VDVVLWGPSGKVVEVPVEGGSLDWSLSRSDGTRSGRITTPGYTMFNKVRALPYAWVVVTVGIRGGGSWSMGEFPVAAVAVDRPTGSTELTLGDWSSRRALSKAQYAVTLPAGRTVASLSAEWLGHVAPGGSVTITRDDTNGALVGSAEVVPIGGDMWAALTTAANNSGAVLVQTSRTTAEVRTFAPTAPAYDCDGTIERETTRLDFAQLVNMVVVQQESSNADGGVLRAVRTLTTGPWASNADGAGVLPLIETNRVDSPSQAAVDAEADRLVARRAGVVRSTTLEVVPAPWVEVGDTVAWTSVVEGRQTGVVETVAMPLAPRESMRLTMRDVSVTRTGWAAS
jgi:hypothetical protein